jgi:reversibly glycosylated polypeptide/UDP-arabinopyranose mutase
MGGRTVLAIVVPTCRAESYAEFIRSWTDLIVKHNALLITVWDGDNPILSTGLPNLDSKDFSLKEIMGDNEDLIYNHNDGVRNLGFAYIAKFRPDVDTIITLDDDTKPFGDTIQDHLNALNKRVSVSWMSTASEYMRGFPYHVRDEAEVVLSHGVWEGIYDWDAQTQKSYGQYQPEVVFNRGPVPKGILYPMCGMNIAFKRKLLPYMYYAPMGPQVGIDRFADIWLGINSKRVIDEKGWAVVTGYSMVKHERASNVEVNLIKERVGLELNEDYWSGNELDPYFKLYDEKRERWVVWTQ